MPINGICNKYLPKTVLIAMRTIEVGVETFSLILCHKYVHLNLIETRTVQNLNRRERIEKEQISTPLPAIALNIPPRNPTKRRTTACQTPNFTIESKVFLLCSLKC